MRNYKSIYFFVVLIIFWTESNAQIQRERAVTLMGSRFEITVIAKDSLTAEKGIDIAINEISRIEDLISDWIPESQVSLINKNAGVESLIVDNELFELIKRAMNWSKITDGAFDITYAAMDRIWKFDGSMNSFPTPEQVQKSVRNVGFENIILDSLNSKIYLKKVGMKISFGSIGKGYAADKARQLLESKGFQAGIINASGDITTWGTQLDRSFWNIGLTNPFDKRDYISVIPMSRKAITTSGSYEKFAEINGKRYSHIINPVTGFPATGIISVTILGPEAETANGLSTSIMVLGLKKGRKLLRNFPSYEAIIIDDQGSIHCKKEIRKLYKIPNNI